MRPAEYELRFAAPDLKPLAIGCCEAVLINEGDLLHNGHDAISIYQAPENGEIYMVGTICYHAARWDTLIRPWLIPYNEDSTSRRYLQGLVFCKGNSLCHMEYDSASVWTEKCAVLPR